jgi:hypothetical protein
MRSWKSILFILNPHGFTSAHPAIFYTDYLPDIGISGIGFTDLSHMKCWINGQSIEVRWMSAGKVILPDVTTEKTTQRPVKRHVNDNLLPANNPLTTTTYDPQMSLVVPSLDKLVEPEEEQ